MPEPRRPEPRKYDVFLSYSREDRYTMRYLRRPLQTSGLRVFADETDIPPGASWRRELGEAIENSCCVVVLLSPDSAKSKWVQEEIDFAHTHECTVIGLIVRGSFKEAVPFGLTSAQLIDLTDGNEAKLEPLIERIHELCGIHAPPLPLLLPQPIDPPTLSALKGYLRAAAKLTQHEVSAPEGRACLFWVDPNRQQLYIIGATDDISHEELALRFGMGEGFVGAVWKLNRFQIANVAAMLAGDGAMEPTLRRITERLKVIIGIPIHKEDPGSEIIGILSIDSVTNTVHELGLDEEDNVRRIYEGAQDIARLIKALPLPRLPFSYRRHNNLRTILRMARLFLAVEPLRATLYCLNPEQDRMRVALVSSKLDLRDSPYLQISFRRNEGIVGKVWLRGESIVSDRTGLSEETLRREWNMTSGQIEKTRDVKSLVGFPIFRQGRPREVIAVLVVASDLPMVESNLDQYTYEFRWLADSIARWLEPEE